MRLSMMWRVDATVDAAGRSPVAERILANWAHDPGSARFFRSSANFVYRFRSDGERRFLRFADASERGRDVVEAELDLVGWLAGAGVAVARPLPSLQENLVETAETDLGAFHAVVFEALDGGQVDDVDDLDGNQVRRWGAALAELHAAMRRYPCAGPSRLPTWRDWLAFAEEHVPLGKPVVRRELDRVAALLGALPLAADNHGPIHGDFELDNLVWGDGTIGILDFDDRARSWYAADVAFALRDLFDAGAGLADARVRGFVRGYREHGRLDDEMLSQVPTFLRLAGLLEYARIARSLDLPVVEGHPEWLQGLRQKLEGRMAAYETSLVGLGSGPAA